jgi:phytoene dehydrogenase-like protein
MLDVAIIGAGHNGLVCACYLAARGLKVALFEARDVVGGAAVTHEFHPGFRNSRLSYTVSLLQPKIIRDLRLHEHGLRIVERPLSNFLPLPDNTGFRLGPTLADTQRTLAALGPAGTRDAQALPAYFAMLDRVAAVLKHWLLQAPPDVSTGVSGLLQFAKLGHGLNGLDRTTQRDLLDLFTKSAGEVLDARFETPALKAAFGWDAQVGHYASPYSPGSAYVLLHHVFGETNGKPGVWGHAVGGMGAITQAMLAEARARGVTVQVNAPVRQVQVTASRVRGLELADGRTRSCFISSWCRAPHSLPPMPILARVWSAMCAVLAPCA